MAQALPKFTKKQCYRKKSVDHKKMLDRFCPLIRATCTPSCMCFQEAHWAVVGSPKDDQNLYYPCYCSSPIITGNIVAEDGLYIYQ